MPPWNKDREGYDRPPLNIPAGGVPSVPTPPAKPKGKAPWTFPALRGLLTCPAKDCDKPADWPVLVRPPIPDSPDDHGTVLEFCSAHGMEWAVR